MKIKELIENKNDKFLFYGNPNKFKSLKPLFEKDPFFKRRFELSLRNNFYEALPSAFESGIERLDDKRSYGFEFKTNTSTPKILLKNVKIDKNTEGFVYVFLKTDKITKKSLASPNLWSIPDDIKPKEIIKVNFEDYSQLFENKNINPEIAFEQFKDFENKLGEVLMDKNDAIWDYGEIVDVFGTYFSNSLDDYKFEELRINKEFVKKGFNQFFNKAKDYLKSHPTAKNIDELKIALASIYLWKKEPFEDASEYLFDPAGYAVETYNPFCFFQNVWDILNKKDYYNLAKAKELLKDVDKNNRFLNNLLNQ